MALTEFDLIARYFTRDPPAGSLVARGVGDDCALLDLGDRQLAVTTDLLLEGRHFFPDVDPESLGHKALAVNLSDLAAAGSAPRCFFLALALPRVDEAWLAAFSRGLFALADREGCVLAGGDTTRTPMIDERPGPITIAITAIGEVPRGAALTRGGAQPGDAIYVSGSLGDAALALAARAGEIKLDLVDAQAMQQRLDRPQPRIALGQALRGIATACMDVSDGLLGDLQHICNRSRAGAEVDWPQVPRSAALLRQSEALQQRCALAGGDDYELMFTAPPARESEVMRAAAPAGTAVTRIGRIVAGTQAIVLDGQGRRLPGSFRAFDHFG